MLRSSVLPLLSVGFHMCVNACARLRIYTFRHMFIKESVFRSVHAFIRLRSHHVIAFNSILVNIIRSLIRNLGCLDWELLYEPKIVELLFKEPKVVQLLT